MSHAIALLFDLTPFPTDQADITGSLGRPRSRAGVDDRGRMAAAAGCNQQEHSTPSMLPSAFLSRSCVFISCVCSSLVRWYVFGRPPLLFLDGLSSLINQTLS